jgi:hypothetical protein
VSGTAIGVDADADGGDAALMATVSLAAGIFEFSFSKW